MARKAKEIQVKEDSMILKDAMKVRGLTQIELADKVGIKQSGLSGAINRKRMALGTFNNILDAMDYDVCVVDRNSGEIVWKVAQDE